jgi:hypothetical protein
MQHGLSFTSFGFTKETQSIMDGEFQKEDILNSKRNIIFSKNFLMQQFS